MHQRIKNLYKESLFRNSFFLMMSTSAQAVIGFLFWFICARLFNPSDVGFATSLISAASLTSVFSMLGFNNVIVRFLPNSNKKDQQLSTAFILTALASFVAAGIFLLGSFTTHSKIVHTDHQLFLIIIFTLYVLAITVNSIAESAFIAYRSTAYILTKNIFFSVLKVLALFLVAALGALGIVGVTMAALFFTLALSYYWLTKKFNYRPVLGIDRTTIAETKHFAIGNYFGTLFGVLPSTTLTLIIFSRLGAQFAAFYYIPSTIITVLNVIPGSTAQSFFAEVSHDEAGLVDHFKKAVKHLFSFLVPAAVIIWILGGYVLHFFGKDYAAAGTWPLSILALASLFSAANYLGDTLLNIKKRSGMYLFMNAFNALAVVIPAYIVAPHGLVAIAWACVCGQVVTAVIYLIMNWQLIIETKKARV